MNGVKFKTGTLKRVLWFGLINLTVVATLVIVTQGAITQLLPLLILYACFAPFVGLLFSKYSAKKAYRLQVLDPNMSYNELVEWYRDTAYHLCQAAGMKKMPELAIYESDDKNAFATGRSKNSSLIAVSSALLEDMSGDGIEAVIAHEVSHIMNGDMVTQTLLQSALNMVVSVIIIPITIFKWFAFFSNERNSVAIYYIAAIFEFLASTVLFFLSGLLLKKYSRAREFKADYLASQLTSPNKMIRALQELDGSAILSPAQKPYAAMQFNGVSRFLDLFSTHPSIERRIKYLEKKFSE